MKLNHQAMLTIREVLDDSPFGAEAFDIINFPEHDSFLVINFLDDPEFHFLLTATRGDGVFGTYNPGEITQDRNFKVGEVGDTFLFTVGSYLQEWLSSLSAELKAKQILHRRDEIARDTFGDFEAKVDRSKGAFTSAQIREMRARLDAFQASMEAHQKDIAASAEEIAKLKKVVEDLKKNLEVLPRKTWERSLFSKLADYGIRWGLSPQGQEFLADSARKLLS
ncbi:MAG TPA: hypothetical protein VEH27_15820 [Methylomirabilota bacterium]|nr:hypothetical protein [Methylomirabilota bacterium]